MFMGDKIEGSTQALVVARERSTRAVFSSAVPRKSTCEGICGRRMAWLRESGLDFVDMIVNSDNKRAPTSLIESWSNLLSTKGGWRMVVENSLAAVSKRHGGESDSIRA